MSNDFYRSIVWRKKREYILKRDGFLCQECKKYGVNRDANIVHHIKELEHHPELRLSNNNLVSVCAKCHNKLHPEKGGRRKF
ncbi:HNH endonuclease [Bacillus sp. 2205SS5-2]|uniref:HNH endonuclease n=1 Tax=Bacillus sp. 2205SS5-2 TaxID=3109031 RepID=UPI003FA60AF4